MAERKYKFLTKVAPGSAFKVPTSPTRAMNVLAVLRMKLFLMQSNVETCLSKQSLLHFTLLLVVSVKLGN